MSCQRVKGPSLNSREGYTEFSGKAANYYQYGQATWLTGLNAGLVSEINQSSAASSNSITFELQVRTGLTIQAGDTCDVAPGCDKTFATCTAKFSNGINYGGFNFIPGKDKMLQSPF